MVWDLVSGARLVGNRVETPGGTGNVNFMKKPDTKSET